MAETLIAVIARHVVEGREAKGWSQLDLSKETGIMHERLRRLEAGEDWMDDESMGEVESALGWMKGVVRQYRQLEGSSDMHQFDPGRITAEVLAGPPEPMWGSPTTEARPAAWLSTCELFRELGLRMAKIEEELGRPQWTAGGNTPEPEDPWAAPAASGGWGSGWSEAEATDGLPADHAAGATDPMEMFKDLFPDFPRRPVQEPGVNEGRAQ